MTFVDTSAIYAWADASDAHHGTAVRRLTRLLAAREPLLTHNYVLVEAMALIQARLGVAAASRLAEDVLAFDVEWVDSELHAAAVREMVKSRRRQLSLVDHTSFLVMRRRAAVVAFAFDPDFEAAGFELLAD